MFHHSELLSVPEAVEAWRPYARRHWGYAAEDILQSAGVQLIGQYGRAGTISKFTALRRIRQVAATMYRSEVRRDRLLHAFQAVANGRRIAQRPSIRLEVAEQLARLSPNERRIVYMRYLEGRTFPEIAAAVGARLEAVKSICRRALERLRRRATSDPE